MPQNVKLQPAVDGKGPSTNDYTTADKDKLKGIEDGATKVKVNNTLTSTSTTEALSAAQGSFLNRKINDLVIELLETAPIDHTHTIANVTGLKDALDSKQSKIVVTTEAPTSATGYADGTIIMVIE